MKGALLWFLVTAICECYGAGKVAPVLIWGTYKPPMDHISAAETVSATKFEELTSAADSPQRIRLWFTQNKFAIEELSSSSDPQAFAYLKTQNVTALARVQDPFDVLAGRHMPSVSIVNETGVQTVGHVLKEEKQVQIRLPDPDENALLQNDPLIRDVMEMVSKQYPDTPITAFLVAHETAPVAVPRRVARALLEATTAANTGTSTPPEGVVAFVDSNVRLFIGALNITGKAGSANFTKNGDLTVTVDSGENSTARVTLSGSSGKYKVFLELNSDADEQSWQITNITGELNGEQKQLAVLIGDMWAAQGFSYSCGLMTVESDNATDTLVFEKFQIQFGSINATSGFGNSFDCTTWFTTSLWAGLLITLFYILILFVGVLFLYEIKTNDRFDDPKGKTITVNVSE